MGLYRKFVLPRLIDAAMGHGDIARLREAHVTRASGVVVEIGIGSGRNLPYYSPQVTRLWGVDPSAELLAMARERSLGAPFPVELVEQSATTLPWPDRTADTAVITFSLCSVANPEAVLREARRVLKPRGVLMFVEHGLSPERGVRSWQNRLTPLWRRVAGGCHLNRPVADLVRAAGFVLDEVRTGYLPGPRPFTYVYEGYAHVDDSPRERF